MDPFTNLPDENILETAFYETINNIIRMCQSSKRFIYDFGQPPRDLNIINWREAYQNYGKVLASGPNLEGELGLGDTQNRSILTLISGIQAKYTSCGYDYTMYGLVGRIIVDN